MYHHMIAPVMIVLVLKVLKVNPGPWQISFC